MMDWLIWLDSAPIAALGFVAAVGILVLALWGAGPTR